MSKLGPHRLQLQGISRPRGHLTGLPFNYSQHYRRSSRNRNPQSAYWRNMTEEKRALEREKSRLRMQASRARKKERERLLTERKKQNETFQQYSSWQTSGEGRDTKRCILYIIIFLNSNQTTIGAYKRCIHVLIKVNWAVHLYINLRDNPPLLPLNWLLNGLRLFYESVIRYCGFGPIWVCLVPEKSNGKLLFLCKFWSSQV